MTVVNPKSISGINSITTGSGSDDILTIHNNNGTERLRIDSTGTTKIVTGIVTTLTATGSAKVGTGVTLSSDGDVFATGVCTATSFSGDGSNLTGLSGVSVANQSDNRVITNTGTTDALNAEANLTFDGSTLGVSGNLDLAADGDTVILGTGDDFQISFDGTNGVIKGVAGVQNVNVWTENVAKYQFTSGALRPLTDNSYDLGDSSLRWRNVYTNDLKLSNKGSSNDVDGTWGDYTIQEGESDLFLINNRNGKKYKFNLTEVS